MKNALQIDTGFSRFSFSNGEWEYRPILANDWAKGIGKLQDFVPVPKGFERAGNVIVFPSQDSSGHVGLYLGGGLYVSSRSPSAPGSVRNSAGNDAVQANGGLEVSLVKGELKAFYMNYSKGSGKLRHEAERQQLEFFAP